MEFRDPVNIVTGLEKFSFLHILCVLYKASFLASFVGKHSWEHIQITLEICQRL